jgi:hypothetical protein
MSLVAFWFLNFSQYELSVVAHENDSAQAVPALDAIEVTRSNGPVVVWRAVEK